MLRISRLGLVLLALAILCMFAGSALAGPFYTGLKVYISQKNWEKAVRVGPQAIEQDSDNPDAYGKFAIALAEVDSLEHAGRMFQQGIDLAKKGNDEKLAKDIENNREHYRVTHYNSGTVTLQDGLAVLDSLGSHADTTKAGVKAAVEEANSKFRKAIPEFQKAIYLKPNDEKAYTQMAVANSSMNMYPEAMQCLKKALEINPDYDAAKQNMRSVSIKSAEQYKTQGRWMDAAKVFEDLVAQGDTASLQDLGDIYYNMAKNAPAADTAAKFGNLRKSADYYGKYYLAHPDTLVEYNYAVALLNAHDYATAGLVVKRMLVHSPLSADNHSLLQNVYAGAGTNRPGAIGEQMALDGFSKGKPLDPAALKPAATSDAGKVMAKAGRPERVYTWMQDKYPATVWFYLSKNELYSFIADQQVGKSSWGQ